MDNYLFSETGTAREALQLINEIAMPNMSLFIVNGEKQLAGALTDGDIRRGLLNGFTIDEKVVKFMNATCKYLVEGDNNFEKLSRYKSSGIRFIPVLDKNMKLLRIIDLESISAIIPADVVLMAGGKGERLKPLTDTIPKPMLKVGDTPIILRNIERLARFGVLNFNISVRHMAEQIEEGLSNTGIPGIHLNFVKETMPLGTIGSVKLVDNFFNDAVILMNSDLLTNIDFQDFYKRFTESGADMLVATVPYHVDVPYAVMNINEKDEVESFSEKPRYTYYSNAGIYILKKELVSLIPGDCVYDATHFMEAVIAGGKKLLSYPILGYWLDIGRIEDFYKAQEDIKHLRF